MNRLLKIFGMLCLLLTIQQSYGQHNGYNISFEFYNDTFNLEVDSSIIVTNDTTLSKQSIIAHYDKVNNGKYTAILDTLLAYKKAHQLNDWLYYQLIRKTAQAISPKKENYERYTFYKWFFLGKSGYDARLTIADNRLIFDVYNDEDISDIPFVMFQHKKYMCLNRHDYAYADLNKVPPHEMISIPEAKEALATR